MTSSSGIIVNIQETSLESDLGVMVKNNLRWTDHITQSVLKANSVLGMLRRTFVNWNANNFLVLYKAYIRPQLEYCSCIWNPYLKKDIKLLESVQRRATKMVPQLKSSNYESRLANLELSTLKDRRDRGDLIQYFKIVRSYNLVTWHSINKQAPSIGTNCPASHIRGANHRLERQFTNSEIRNQFLSNRIVPHWNNLPNEVVSAKSINGFKNKLDKYLSSITPN